MTSTTARDAAITAVAKHRGGSARGLGATTPRLWIYDAGILGGPGPGGPVLVWRMDVKGDGPEPIDEMVLVDAQLGSVLLRIDNIAHAKNRQVCDANSTAAQYPCTAPVRSEGQPAHTVSDVNDAYDFAGDTYDFFFGLGRDGLDGAGMTLKSTVRYCPDSFNCPFQNAFWDGQQMVYGTGFAAADDVVGHELTHGVTDFSASLFYYFQSGAINESLSDVFGEFVDLSNTRGTDTAATRWQLGEDLPGIGAIRDMENPPAFGDPDRMTSPNYTSDSDEEDSGGVHRNSGVNNKAAFLMTDGATFNGRTVTGLGIDKVKRIYYLAQTGMLTSASDYADLATALQQACTNLVGTAGITTADCVEVGDAVAAVEMTTDPPVAPAPEAPVCGSGASPTDLFFDNLENTASGNWTTQIDWYYPQTASPYNFFDPTFATSGTHNFWGYDRPSVGDYSISMTNSVAIPSGSTTYLRFNHSYGFEDDAFNGYDGGVLEYSTNGGSSWNDAGTLLSDNGYDGTIASGTGNPLANRQAFVGESNGYRSSRATLSSLGGQSVRFRFRIGTDGAVDDYGWFVDDVRIYTCASSPTPPAPPTLSDTDPDSPANENAPRVKGSAAAGSTVNVYTSPSCSGSPVATGTAASFASPGVQVSVADNSTTTFYATATGGGGTSSCSSSSIIYVEDSSPPAPPTLSDTDPDSPADNNFPRVKGSAPGDTTVRLYTNAFCSGPPVASGPAASVASPGLEVFVADNSTITLYATATDAAGNSSACSLTSITYQEVTSGGGGDTGGGGGGTGGGGGGGATLPPAKANLASAKGSIRVSATGRFSYSFRAGAGLGGGAVFKTRKKAVVSRRAHMTISRKRFTVPASGKVTLRIKLSRKNLRILRSNRRLLLRVTVTVRSSAGSAVTRKNLTLRAPRR